MSSRSPYRYHPYMRLRDVAVSGALSYGVDRYATGPIADYIGRNYLTPRRGTSARKVDGHGLRPQHQTKSRISGMITKYGDPGIPRKRYLRRRRLRRGRIPRKRKYRRYTW